MATKAALEPLRNPLEKEKKANECLSSLLDTSKLNSKVNCADETADTVQVKEEEKCECKVDWGNQKETTMNIRTGPEPPKPDEGCGCPECKEAVRRAWANKLPLKAA